nr:toll/interleukin-1 receptor domain-containing protein [Mycobacterium rhizamassiliense]
MPLRDALVEFGISVWLDETEMRLGHSLRQRIDEGIRSSRFGVVILSPSFFGKGWTNMSWMVLSPGPSPASSRCFRYGTR